MVLKYCVRRAAAALAEFIAKRLGESDDVRRIELGYGEEERNLRADQPRKIRARQLRGRIHRLAIGPIVALFLDRDDVRGTAVGDEQVGAVRDLKEIVPVSAD